MLTMVDVKFVIFYNLLHLQKKGFSMNITLIIIPVNINKITANIVEY